MNPHLFRLWMAKEVKLANFYSKPEGERSFDTDDSCFVWDVSWNTNYRVLNSFSSHLSQLELSYDGSGLKVGDKSRTNSKITNLTN